MSFLTPFGTLKFIILSVYFFRVSHQRSFHFQFHEKALKDNSIDTREKNAEICTYISGFKRANTGVFATFINDFDVESEIEKVYWTLNFSRKHVVCMKCCNIVAYLLMNLWKLASASV